MMTLHVLHAGDGYEYLTKQVATADRERAAGQSLTDYYTAHGTPPGRWLGSGLTALEQVRDAVEGAGPTSVCDGNAVTEAHMKALFGEGLHPEADELSPLALAAGISAREAKERARLADGLKPSRVKHTPLSDSRAAAAATRLGRPFPKYVNNVPLLSDHRDAVSAFEKEHQRPATTKESAVMLREHAERIFTADHGRKAEDTAELDAWIGRQRKRQRQPVAGYDFVFTPSKSVATAWGVGNNDTRRAIESAHHQAVRTSMKWFEENAAYTRTGSEGQETRNVTGMIAAAFDHYDSRAGDPNLHTHVTVSNKVFMPDESHPEGGKWLSLDGATLHRHRAAAAELYNATIMDTLRREHGFDLRVRGVGEGKQPVIELSDVPDWMCKLFSSRRTDIEARYDELAATFRDKHGRSPDEKTQYRLYQQATTDTRAAKAEHAPSLAEQNAQWTARVRAEIMNREGVGPEEAARIHQQYQHTWAANQTRDTTLAGGLEPAADPTAPDLSPENPAHMRRWNGVDDEVPAVLDALENKRAIWTDTQLQRAVRGTLQTCLFDTPQDREDAVSALTATVRNTCIPLEERHSEPSPTGGVPTALRRSDGTSVLSRVGTASYTSDAVLAAERTLLAAAFEPSPYLTYRASLHATIADQEQKEGFALNEGQVLLAEHFTGTGTVLAAAVGPAGTGKTSSMKAVAADWTKAGRTVIALAPSASAAAVLGEEIGAQGRTLQSLTYAWRGKLSDSGLPAKTIDPRVDIGPGTMLLVDEASLAPTQDLAAIVEIARERGAIVRLLGDPRQIDAVETGGALELIADTTRAPELTIVQRMREDTEQAENTLLLRAGDPDALELYYDRGWVHDGTTGGLIDQLVADHLDDRAADKTSMIMVPTRELAAQINEHIQRHHRATGTVDHSTTTTLADDHEAGRGDTIITRRNNNELTAKLSRGRHRRVDNGDLWTVRAVNTDGSLTVRHQKHRGTVTLPADYVHQYCELGYTGTVHRAQGATVDIARTLASSAMTLSNLYVALTRGRESNHIYTPTDTVVTQQTEGAHLGGLEQPDSRTLLLQILANDQRQRSAHAEIAAASRDTHDPARLREAYETAHTALTGAWVDHLLDTSLPAADHHAITTGDPDSHARLRAHLAALHTAGIDTGTALNNAIGEGDFTGIDNLSSLLLARLPKPPRPGPQGADVDNVGPDAQVPTDTLPQLPRRHRDTDIELDDFARRIADAIAATTETTPSGDDLDTVLTRYLTRREHLLATLDEQNETLTAGVEVPTDAAYDLLRATYGPAVDADPAYRDAARRLAVAALATDTTTEELLSDLRTQLGPLPSAREISLAAAHTRGDLRTPGAPTAIPTPPRNLDTEDTGALADDYNALREHTQTLREHYLTATADQLPDWTDHLGPRPELPAHAATWAELATDIDLHRRSHHITDITTALGERPDAAYRDRRRTHDRLADQIDHLSNLEDTTRDRLDPHAAATRYRQLHHQIVDAWVDRTLAATLPAAEYTTMTTAHPATAQRLRRRLEKLHNSGHDIGELLNNALADNDLTTVRDTAAWLTAALPTPAKPERANPEQWPTLEPLPPAAGLPPALLNAAQAEADTYTTLTADLPTDNAAAAELREDPARLTTRRDLERAAGYTGTPAPTPPAAIAAAEEAATRLDDMKTRYQQEEPARALLAKLAELDESDRGIRYRAAGATSEISNLGILDRSRRKELTALLATLETQRTTIAEQRTAAEQQLTELAPQGPRSLVAAPDIERAHHDLADARRDADKAATRHEQALETHHTRIDAAAAAEEELDRRQQLTPASRNQEQRLRTTIAARINKKPRQQRARIDHTNPAATREYQREHRNTPAPDQRPDTGRDTGL